MRGTARPHRVKRTPLKRGKVPLRAKAGLKRGTSKLKRTKLAKVNASRLAKRRKAYAAYLQSATWKAKREAALKRAGHRCEMIVVADRFKEWVREDRCPETTRLHVHHLNYQRFGHENHADLQVLCKKHHEEVEARDFPHRQRGHR